MTRKPGLDDGASIPRIEARLASAHFDAGKLERYCQLCGFPGGGEEVPLTYPMVLATSLYVRILLTREFPFPPLGLIHTGSTIHAHRPLRLADELTLLCWVEGHREAKRGIELDLVTSIEVAEERVWESSNTVLARARGKGRKEPRGTKPRSTGPLPEDARNETWAVPGNTGRRFARVSGDYNPIHLFGLSAKLFGFKRAIAHGLWTLARSLAALGSDLPSHGVKVDAEFKRPILLPAEVRFSSHTIPKGMAFAVSSSDGRTPHLMGRVARD
ncbi:MaoC/PaaZ C-terminal domain-containing protein [Myxococcota bacterium]